MCVVAVTNVGQEIGGSVGRRGAKHAYNEFFLNNRWVRVDNSIGTGPFVGDKLFVKAWSSASWNNLKEEWHDKRCFKALDASDACPKYQSEIEFGKDWGLTYGRIDRLRT